MAGDHEGSEVSIHHYSLNLGLKQTSVQLQYSEFTCIIVIIIIFFSDIWNCLNSVRLATGGCWQNHAVFRKNVNGPGFLVWCSTKVLPQCLSCALVCFICLQWLMVEHIQVTVWFWYGHWCSLELRYTLMSFIFL